MISSARRAGDFRVLFPRGIKRAEDVPWPLQEAINHGLAILAWFENYVTEELPHENLWDDTEAIEDHFRKVQEKKKAEMGGGKSAWDDDTGGDDLTPNDLASVFKQ